MASGKIKIIMDKKITDYFYKQKSPQKEICHKLRSIVLKTLSGAEEEMKWGVPAFVGSKKWNMLK